jgi:hypothetical protein
MRELEIYCHAAGFSEASRQARWLAKLIHDCTGVRRGGASWAVLAPEGTLSRLTGPFESGDPQYADVSDESAERVAEFLSNQDDWARNEQSGWFYPDQD